MNRLDMNLQPGFMRRAKVTHGAIEGPLVMMNLRNMLLEITVGFESLATCFTIERSDVFMSMKNMLFQGVLGHEYLATSFTRCGFSLPFSFLFDRHDFVGIWMLKGIV